MAINSYDKALQALFKMATEKTAWENASPGSAFPGQSIDIPGLQEYEIVYIRAKYSTGAYASFDLEIPTDIGTTANIAIAVSSIANRGLTIGENAITFKNGFLLNSFDGAGIQNNSASIPLEIILKRKKP